MTELNLRFEFSQDTNLEQKAEYLEKRISQLQGVEEIEAAPEKMKLTGIELAAAIGVTVIIVRNSRELIQEIRKLIPEIKGLVEDLKTIYIDVGDERVPIEELTEEHYVQLDF